MKIFSVIYPLFTLSRVPQQFKSAINGLTGVTLLLISGAVCAHNGESPVSGQWIEKQLIMKHNSNWSTEHCMELPGNQTIEYRFTATASLNFNFHVHPIMEDGSHRTDKLGSQTDLLSYEGKVAAELPGNYCFDFFPSHRHEEDKEVHLFYLID